MLKLRKKKFCTTLNGYADIFSPYITLKYSLAVFSKACNRTESWLVGLVPLWASWITLLVKIIVDFFGQKQQKYRI